MIGTYHELFSKPERRFMSDLHEIPRRDANGHFLPGQSGNPAGKKPGMRNRATILSEMLDDGEARTIARSVIDKALAGNAVAARFIVGRLTSPPRPADRARSAPVQQRVRQRRRYPRRLEHDGRGHGRGRDHAGGGPDGDAGARFSPEGRHRGGAGAPLIRSSKGTLSPRERAG